MSFINGSLTVQGIQINLPALGSIKFGPFAIPFSDQYQSQAYQSADSGTYGILPGYNGVLVIPNNLTQDMMTLQFALGDPSPLPFISPEYASLIVFDPNNYPDQYAYEVSGIGGEMLNVILF